jgi:hypothetical protein
MRTDVSIHAQDEGQNLFLKGLSRPARLPKMESAGTVDKTSLAAEG